MVVNRYRLALFGVPLLCAFGCVFASTTDSYYCPRSAAFLVQVPALKGAWPIVAVGGGTSEPYLRSMTSEKGGQLTFETADCSTKEYECLEFVQHQTLEPEKRFYLALPKRIHDIGTYRFRELQLVVEHTRIPIEHSSSTKQETIQVTIWQQIGSVEKPMQLTLEQKRGVIFWDGLDFWRGRFGIGETCALMGKKGLFSNVVIDIPATKSKPAIE